MLLTWPKFKNSTLSCYKILPKTLKHRKNDLKKPGLICQESVELLRKHVALNAFFPEQVMGKSVNESHSNRSAWRISGVDRKWLPSVNIIRRKYITLMKHNHRARRSTIELGTQEEWVARFPVSNAIFPPVRSAFLSGVHHFRCVTKKGRTNGRMKEREKEVRSTWLPRL